nr:VapE domain-containing protein [Flavobacterium sp. LC2016-13]
MQPCITGSCVMDKNGRSIKNILFLSGLAVIDKDILPNCYNDWREYKNDLEKDPYSFIVHYSLSGKGLCVYVKIPIGNNFKQIFLSLANYYDLMYGAKIDFLADETRLRFIAYDPAPFYNLNSKVYTDILKEDLQELPTVQLDDDFTLNAFSTDPATAFNNSGLLGLEISNALLVELGYTITAGKTPAIFEYQRAGGSLKSIVAFYNKGVVLFQVFSPNTGLKKENYNLYELYKELSDFDDYKASKELAKLGFGLFNEAKPMRPNSKESYSQTLDFLEQKEIRLNSLTGVIEINGSPLNDYHISNMVTELSLLSGKNQSKEILLSCIDVISNSSKVHPFLNFIKELEKLPKTDFTKIDELDRLIDCFESSTPKKLTKIYFTRWLLGLFDLHILNRMTKNVLIFSGAQNAGKTSVAKNILTEPLKQYGKVVEFNQNKITDTKIALCSILVACFDEFEDILTKSKTLSEFKNLTSSYDIYERRPYRRNHEQMFRSSIIMATTNEKNILNDSTGNTRFLTLDVRAFDLNKYFKIDLNKVWKVIYDFHLLGETSVLNEDERSLQAAENQNFESEDVYEGLIENSFHADLSGFVTSTEILLELERNTKQPLFIKRIGMALKKMGVERKSKRVDGAPKYGYALKFNFEA